MATADCDVLVAGGGPAGIAAAITCMESGLRVRIVTRPPVLASSGPGPMQSLHPKAMPLLGQLGAASVLDACAEALFDRIHSGTQARTFSPYAAFPVFGYHVNRDRFDAGLLQVARAAGIPISFDAVADVIIDDGIVTGLRTRSGAALHARAVIDATGYARILARRIGLGSTPYSPPLVVHTGLIDSATPFPMRGVTRFEGRPDGWSWFATASGGALMWTTLHARSGKHDATTAELARRSVPGSVSTFDATWKLTRPLASRGLLVAGDAAGRVDPAWGQGIVNALATGIEAARTLIDSAASPGGAAWLHAGYDAACVARHEEACDQLGSYYASQGIAVLDDRFSLSHQGAV